MPDAMSARPRTNGLLWSGLGAVVGLWIGYAVVAGMAEGTPSPSPTPAPRPVRRQQPTSVAKPKPKPKPAPDFDDSTPTGFDNSG
jgi:hypothetical protein